MAGEMSGRVPEMRRSEVEITVRSGFGRGAGKLENGKQYAARGARFAICMADPLGQEMGAGLIKLLTIKHVF